MVRQVKMNRDLRLAVEMRAFLLFAAVLGATFLMAGMHPVYGQITTASLQGTAQDASGAVIPNASVKIVNTSTNEVTQTTTNASGRFVFPSLPPGGPYTLSVSSAGFKLEQRSGILLDVNQTVDIPVVLQIGSENQKVEIDADVTQLGTSNGSLGDVIGTRPIADLPLNQRNVYSLVFLVPGVTGSVGTAYNSFNLSVDGGRPGTSLILVDGIPASPPLANPIGGISVFPSVDAIQEFKVELTGYSAEFGRSTSGVINLILKSGTNNFHGSLYEFLRNSALDANTYFADANKTPLPHFERSQFGGSLSGPIWIPKLYNGKDKTFFLFSYEGLRQGTQSESYFTVPTALERTGDFSQSGQIIYDPEMTVPSGSGYVRSAFPLDKIPTNRIDKVGANVVNYYPLPNLPGLTNNYFAAGVAKMNIDTFDAKVDQVFNERNRMFVRYSRQALVNPPVLLFPAAQQVAEGGDSQPQISSSAAIDYTRTFSPSFVMEIPAGFSRTALNYLSNGTGFDPTTLGFPSYMSTDADHLLFPGIAPANYTTLGNAGAGETRHAGYQVFTIGVNNTKIYKNQLIKFGGEAQLLQANDLESGDSTGTFSFSTAITQGPNPNTATSTGGNSIASLLLGLGTTGTYEIGSKNVASTSRYYGLYIQDDWKALPRLTVNLGLRYDLEIPRTERYNRMETFNTTIASPLATQAGLAGLTGGTVFPGTGGLSRRQYNPQWLNFGPRLGFSYELNSNTAIRAAYGVYFGPALRAAGATVGNEGFSATTSYTGSANGLTPSVYLSNPFPTGINFPVGNSQGLLTGIGTSFETPVTGDNKVGYTQVYNLDIQRQLPFNILIDAAYVGSHGVHLNKAGENNWNLNQLSPATLALGTQLQQSVANPFYGIIKTGPESSSTIVEKYLKSSFPQFVAVDASYLTGGYELYDAFQLKVQKRLSRGLNALIAFTGSKQMDDFSGISNVGQGSGAGIQDIWNPQGEYAVSANDISRQLVASVNYSLPFGRGQQFGGTWSWPVDGLLGGWQLNTIIHEATGFPLAPTTTDTSNSGGTVLRPNLTGISPIVGGPVTSRLKDYVKIAAFSQPAAFTFGDSPRTLPDVRAPGSHNIDFSVFKSFHPTREVDVQFRAEAFNMLNQVVFSAPNMVFSSGQFGVISAQSNTPRQIQFALKILF